MSDASVVTVPDPLHNLLKDPFGFCLLQSSILLSLQVAMETATPNILHNEYHILRGIYDLIEPDYVLVAHLLHQLDLSLHTLAPVRVHQLVLLVDLHGDLTIAGLVQSHSDHGIGTLTNLLTNHIVIQ
jgi:hypothetical protein